MSSRAVVGREVPLRVLGEALDSAAGGTPSLALVSGEAGIGKTRLVGEIEAAARGFVVLHGECLELGGGALAYAPVTAALRGLPAEWTRDWLDELPVEARGALAAVLPRESPGAGGPARLHELLLDLLGRLAAERAPVLLVLEDVHWADPSTLALLAFLARNLREQRVAVVVTYRVDDALPAELRRLAAELSRRRSVLRIELEPLGREDVARQLEAIAGAPVPAALAGELHARAGGNPFFVEELFAARDALPGSVTEAVLARVERLDQPALALLAAAGGQASHALLERLEVAPDALRAALDAGVLVRTADGVAFRHGLIGEVIYERLLPVERRALHRAIAAVLDANAPAAQRALQSYRAGLREQALAASVQAGLEAADVHAYTEAGVHFERALELWDASVDRVDLLARTAQAARFAGDPERAVALCREAIELTDDPARKALLYERLGEFHFWDDEAALECYRHALELLPGEPRLLAAEGHALFGLRRWEDARERCEAALEAGAGPRITLGLVLAYLGRPDEGEAHLRRALELAANGEETARAYMHLGELLRLRGDHEAALEAMVDGEREAARLGLLGSFGHFMYVNGADDLLRLGRWDEAAARLAEAERIDLSRTASALRRGIAGLLGVCRGDVEAARRELDGSADDGLPSEFLAPLGGARAALAMCEGDLAAARVHLDGALAGVQDPLYTPPLYSLALRVEADAADHDRAHRRAPDTVRADALVTALEALVEDTSLPCALAHRSLARAEHARVAGDPAARALARRGSAVRCPQGAVPRRVRAAARGGGDADRAATGGRRCSRSPRRTRPRSNSARGPCARRRRRSRGARGSISP